VVSRPEQETPRRPAAGNTKEGLSMVRLRTIGPLVRPLAPLVRPPPRQINSVYNTPEFQAWRARVVKRAGYQCEAIVDGQRCSKATPHHRIYADHIIELSDGGAPFDVNNGRCLCATHHTRKTAAARARRLKEVPKFQPGSGSKTGG
jgi:5-methylcytosine-specific restriction enzyme A